MDLTSFEDILCNIDVMAKDYDRTSIMSALGHKQTHLRHPDNVCFPAQSGHYIPIPKPLNFLTPLVFIPLNAFRDLGGKIPSCGLRG